MCRVFPYFWAECHHITIERLICGRAPCTDVSPGERMDMRGKCINCLRLQHNIQGGTSEVARVTQHVPSHQTTLLNEMLMVENYVTWDEQRRRETILEENRLIATANSERALTREEAHRLAELLDNAYAQIMRRPTEAQQFFGLRRLTPEPREIMRLHRLSEAVLGARVQTHQESRIERVTREVTIRGVRAMVSLLERAPEQPEDDRCPICYDVYTEEHFPVHVPCPARHVLGVQCIITWIQEIAVRNRTRYNPDNGTCPCCRALFIDLSSSYGWFTEINPAQAQNNQNNNNNNDLDDGGAFLDIGIIRGQDLEEDGGSEDEFRNEG